MRGSRLAFASVLVALTAVTEAGVARAQDAGARAAGDAGGHTAEESSVLGCVESIPPGAQRPLMTEVFPARGMSGYASTLKITVEHGKGESVLPRGLELQTASDAIKVLKTAGFVIPHQDGGAGARLESLPSPKADRATTVLELPLLALPAEPGRHTLTLPPLPVAVARANGEIATACTRPHAIVIEDPTASTPDAKPQPNPPPRPQREEWTALKEALVILSIGVLAGAIATYLVRRWTQRPRPVPPPPPPRPPWEVALEKLDEVRHAGLLEQGRFAEYFDRVSDALRGYLGARYDFDGLESTTDEIVRKLSRSALHGLSMPELVAFLQDCDLVKFANMTPSVDECTKAIADGERIVRLTMPRERAFDGTEVGR